MVLEYVDEIVAAGDGTTSLVISTPGSKSRAAVEALLSAVAEAILTGDTFIRDAAAAAMTEAAAEGNFLKAEEEPIEGDDGTINITSQSGYLLMGWKRTGELSTFTQTYLRDQVAYMTDVPKIPGVYRRELSDSGFILRTIYDDGRQEFPGLIGGGGGNSEPHLIYDYTGGVMYATDVATGIRTPVGTDRSHLTISGTSTFARSAPQFATWAAPHGATVVNTASAGVGAEHSLAKLGSRPLMTSGTTTIAASGSSSVTSSNVPSGIHNTWSVSGYFQDHPEAHGTISKPSNGGVAAWTFTRDTAGSGFTVPAGTKFIPDATVFRNSILVANIGKNNGTGLSGVTADVSQVVQWTHEMYEWATSTAKSVLIVGHFIDTDTPADSPTRARLNLMNTEFSGYGARFSDMGAYVGSMEIFNDLGLTPNPDDLAQIALGNKAPQISSLADDGTIDPLHLSIAGADAVINNQIGRSLVNTLNWMQE